jgi:hypothetical protein
MLAYVLHVSQSSLPSVALTLSLLSARVPSQSHMPLFGSFEQLGFSFGLQALAKVGSARVPQLS